MAVLGSLTAILRADTRRFKTEMSGAGKVVKQLKSTIGGALGTVSKLGAIFGGISVAGIAYFVRGQMQAIDSVAKLSDRLNISTEALVGFQHAASIAGSSSESMTKAIEKMVRSIGQAGQGLMTQQRAFESIGLSVESLAELNAEEQFLSIAEGISTMGSASEQAATAADIFGRAGVELLNTLKLGRSGLVLMREEAEALGLTFSRLDAAKVEAANDSITRMSGAIKGVGRAMAIELAPYIEAAANAFVEWAQSGEGAAAKVVDGIAWVVEGVGTAVDVFSVLKGTVQLAFGIGVGVAAAFAGALGLAVQAAEGLLSILSLGFVDSDIGAGIRAAADEMWDFGEAMAEAGYAAIESGIAGEAGDAAAENMRKIKEEANAAAGAVAAMGNAASGAADELGEMTEEAKAAASAAESLAKAQDALLARFNDAVDSYSPGFNALKEELGDQMGLYESLVSAGLFEEARVLREIVAEEKKHNDELEKQKKDKEFIAGYEQEMLDLGKKLTEAANQKADAVKREKDLHEDTKRSMERELDLLRAGNDYERERLRIMYDLQDAIDNANGDLQEIGLAKQIAAEKIADLNQDIADAAERESKAHKESANESERQARAMQDQADITKRFAAAPGTGGLFGFGKGRVGGFSQFYQPSVVQNRKRTAGVAQDPAGVAAPAVGLPEPAKLPDLSPKVEAILKAWEKVPPLWERLDTGLGELQRASESGLERMTRSAEKATATLRDAVRTIDRKVDAFEDRLNRASDLSVAGG